MRNFVAAAPGSVIKYTGLDNYRNHCGLLTSPRNRHHPRNLPAGGVWAADNDCFTSYNPAAIVRFLRDYSGIPGCIFVVVPDSIQDASGTLTLFKEWIPTYKKYGFPGAFVAHNDIEKISIPWDDFECLFIGGSNEFKYSQICRQVAAEAKNRGKWIHNGRVNSMRRIRYSGAIGCDSFDGTNYTRAPHRVKEHLASQLYHEQSLI